MAKDDAEAMKPNTVHGWLEDALGRYQVTHIHSSVREALKIMNEPPTEAAQDGPTPVAAGEGMETWPRPFDVNEQENSFFIICDDYAIAEVWGKSEDSRRIAHTLAGIAKAPAKAEGVALPPMELTREETFLCNGLGEVRCRERQLAAALARISELDSSNEYLMLHAGQQQALRIVVEARVQDLEKKLTEKNNSLGLLRIKYLLTDSFLPDDFEPELEPLDRLTQYFTQSEEPSPGDPEEARNGGAGLIQQERLRQVAKEGWTPEHDNLHRGGEMLLAARSYMSAASLVSREAMTELWLQVRHCWPWDIKWWKPSEDPIRNLVKAGALIAAEIDRFQRLPSPPEAAKKEETK